MRPFRDVLEWFLVMRKGVFWSEEAGNVGSLRGITVVFFLDEIRGSFCKSQAKPLCIRRNRNVKVVERKRTINVRVIERQHVNLEKAILRREVLGDLYYRLINSIQIPFFVNVKEIYRRIGTDDQINQDYGRTVEGSLIQPFLYLHHRGRNWRELKIFWGELISLWL